MQHTWTVQCTLYRALYVLYLDNTEHWQATYLDYTKSKIPEHLYKVYVYIGKINKLYKASYLGCTITKIPGLLKRYVDCTVYSVTFMNCTVMHT